MSRLRGSIAVAVGACLLPSAVAQTYSVNGNVTGSGGTQSTTSNPGSATLPDGSGVTGVATQTGLGATSLAVSVNDKATMTVSRAVSDWTVSGPAGSTTTAAMNLGLTGSLAADTWYGYAWAEIGVDIVDTANSQTVFNDGVGFELEGDGTGQNVSYIWDTGSIGAGGFSAFVNAAEANPGAVTAQLPAGLAFVTNPISWTAGDVYDVTMSLKTYATNGSPTPASDSAQFPDPFSFGQPEVLDLPSGWNLNSPQSGISGNHLSTPEPESVAVVAVGIAGLLFRRKRPSQVDRREGGR